MEGIGNLWEASVTMQYQMAFTRHKDVYTLRRTCGNVGHNLLFRYKETRTSSLSMLLTGTS